MTKKKKVIKAWALTGKDGSDFYVQTYAGFVFFEERWGSHYIETEKEKGRGKYLTLTPCQIIIGAK